MLPNPNKVVKVSAVSYANTYPFIYGIKQIIDAHKIELSQDIPADCAQKLSDKLVDVGLIPIAKLADIPNGRIISDYCIGAKEAVKTVLLMSRVPMDAISDVYLDSESRTSVNLIKVLAKNFLLKDWQWKEGPKNFPDPNLHQSIVLIGDKTYKARQNYPFVYDLAELWFEFTGKPFVFAAWVANCDLPDDFISEFNSALSYGLHNIDAALDVYADEWQKEELKNYLTNYISYDLDREKKEGMNLFLEYLKEL